LWQFFVAHQQWRTIGGFFDSTTSQVGFHGESKGEHNVTLAAIITDCEEGLNV
jgi:hypothetical protein